MKNSLIDSLQITNDQLTHYLQIICNLLNLIDAKLFLQTLVKSSGTDDFIGRALSKNLIHFILHLYSINQEIITVLLYRINNNLLGTALSLRNDKDEKIKKFYNNIIKALLANDGIKKLSKAVQADNTFKIPHLSY